LWSIALALPLLARRRWPVETFAALAVADVDAHHAGRGGEGRASLEERGTRLERERDQQGQLAAGAERARIAREMHDIVAHNLSVMIALADGAAYAVGDAPDRAQDAMQRASRTGRQALNEMRRLLGVLREDTGAQEQTLAPQPGLAEIDALIAQVRATGLPVRYEISGQPSDAIPAGLQLAVYRIVQEALTNTLKHAGPDACWRASPGLGLPLARRLARSCGGDVLLGDGPGGAFVLELPAVRSVGPR
jgi:signal transduction histidine kinase